MSGAIVRGRVLIIDDDHLVGAMLASHAKAAGFDVKVTDQPEEFYRLEREWQPTFVVVDLVMGEVDGLAVLKHLAETGSKAAVVIASGMGSRVLDSARQFAAASGLAYTGVLAKPFRRADVARVLDSAIHGPEAKDVTPEAVESWTPEEFSHELRAAAAGDALSVVFQPKISCVSGQTVGFEALVRWRHPQFGWISPAAFIPRAESVGLVHLVTDRVAELALGWFAASRGHTQERLAINISASELNGAGLGGRLAAACARVGLPHGRVILELTETSAMLDAAASLAELTRLRLEGFALSIDDFGTGYSSLAQLSSMPVSEIKIDRSFVRDLGSSLPATVMVRSTLELGRGLGLECTAEGVETEEALAELRALGCDFAQGFFIAKPMSSGDLEQWLDDRGER